MDSQPYGTPITDLDEGAESPFLKVADLKNQDMTVTIRRVEKQTLGRGAKAEQKLVVFFDEFQKGMVLNVTNRNTIKDLYGSTVAGFIGKRITIWPKPDVEYEGRIKPGLRIRPNIPTGTPVPRQAAAPKLANTAFQSLVMELILEKVNGDMTLFEDELFRRTGTRTIADVDDALALEVAQKIKAGG